MFPATLWRLGSVNLRATTAPLPSSSSFVTDSYEEDKSSQIITMAPIQLEPETRYGTVVAVVSHFAVAVYLTVQAGRSLLRAYRGLGPSQDTRGRVARRNTTLPIFVIKVWASSRMVELPIRFYGEHGIVSLGANATPIYPVQWLSDTPIYIDAVEIIAEKSRRFWWGQQVELGLVSWSMLLAIEGRRRNIPLLWCYQLLGQLVSLSFAQNIFFVATLLTPLPLPAQGDGSLRLSRFARLRNRLLPPKPANWTPHASVFSGIVALNFVAILLLPHQANTEHFKYFVLASRALTITPLLVQHVLPASWGSTYRDLRDVCGTYKRLFKAISLASFLLHIRATVLALAYSAPEAYYHRHSVHLPFDVEKRSAWERTTSAFGRILEAASDHPVVGAAGWDVILATVSIGFWVTIRATDVSDILASTLPAVQGQPRNMNHLTPEPQIVTCEKAKAPMADSDRIGVVTEESVGGGLSTRRRGSQKIKQELDENERAYVPTPSEVADIAEGEELPRGVLDWEPAAVVWGLTALGGLGVGSAGAHGSECIGGIE